MYAWAVMWALACGGSPEAPATEAAPAAAAPAAAPAEIRMEDFIGKHAEGVTLIDVRTPAEWEAGRLPGATHLPLADLDPSHPEMKKLSKDTEIYFICASGGRSGKATERMRAAGFQAVNVLGGTNAWIANGKPVEKD
jgi:rhodanese-related sulfurtransferase